MPERRIYVRSDRATRYYTLSPVSQLFGVLAIVAAAGWTGYASYQVASATIDSGQADARVEATRAAYEIKIAALRKQQRALEEELNRSVARGDKVTAVLSDKQRLLVKTASRLQKAEIELSGLRGSYREALGEQRVGRDRLNALNEEITRLRLAMIEKGRRGRSDDETLKTFAVTMSTVLSERDRAAARARALDSKVAGLSRKLATWQDRQETMIARIENATRTSIGKLDELFVGTDVNLKDVLHQAKRDYTGRGGPDDGGTVEEDTAKPVASRMAGSSATAAVARHVAAVNATAAARNDSATDSAARDAAAGTKPEPASNEQRLAALMTDLERMSLLRIAVDRLPFGVPTRGAEQTSGFGYRRDPYRRRSRLHKGMDFAAPVGTPIYATAQGVVVYSGRLNGYGTVVKIRHAFGFETVYAHLSKSRVSVGQRVERGELIADMGNTGRSTGSHLHYEVRVNGLPINPIKFIRAPRNVL